jgi:hypothetical protein
LCQQFGVYGNSSAFLPQFIQALFTYWQRRYWRINYSFNTDSLVAGVKIPEYYSILERVNQELDCSVTKEAIWKAISETKQKHIRRAERVVQPILNTDAAHAVQAFIDSETGVRLSFNSQQKAIVFALASAFTATNSAVWYHLENKEINTVLLGLLQVHFGNRIISLFGGPTNSAKDNYAQDYALWQSMQRISGLPNAVLDFEGSNIKGVQQYNAAFGAKIRYYTHLSWKRW